MGEDVRRPSALPPVIAAHPLLVFNKIGIWVHTLIDGAVSTEGLRARHYLVMSVLRAGQHSSQQEIGEKLNIDKATMVAVINELERRGLLGRERNPADKRHYRLWVTPGGTAWIAQMDVRIGDLEAEMFGPLEAGELATMMSLVQRLFVPPEEEPSP